MEQFIIDKHAAQQALDRIHIDMFSLQGQKMLLMVDEFSTFIHIHRFQHSPSAANIVSALQDWFVQCGFPKRICSDGEKILDSQEVAAFYEANGIVHELSSAENPTSNSVAECHVGLCKDVIRRAEMLNENVNYAISVFNSMARQELGISPSNIFYGRVLRFPGIPSMQTGSGDEELMGRAARLAKDEKKRKWNDKSVVPKAVEYAVGDRIVYQDERGEYKNVGTSGFALRFIKIYDIYGIF